MRPQRTGKPQVVPQKENFHALRAVFTKFRDNIDEAVEALRILAETGFWIGADQPHGHLSGRGPETKQIE